MSKALVIKNVNFGTNKLDTVTLVDPIPCTALSLDKSTHTFTEIGSTVTLTATVTPVNTTYSVEWVTSNQNIATVVNGVVTQVGVGTVTITATCGTQTATCVITATNVLDFEYLIKSQGTKMPATERDHLVLAYNNNSTLYAGLYSTVQTPYKVYKDTADYVEGNIYPIKFGNNASSIVATAPSNIKVTMWFADCDTICDYATDHPTAAYAKFISGDASVYDSSVPAGNRTKEIPEGANSAVFTLFKTGSGAVMTSEDVAQVTITAV